MSLAAKPSAGKKQQKSYRSPGSQPLRLLWRACQVDPDKVWEKVQLFASPKERPSGPFQGITERSVQTELLDTLYWIRQAVGLSSGLIWGALPLTGLNAFILCVVVIQAAAGFCRLSGRVYKSAAE